MSCLMCMYYVIAPFLTIPHIVSYNSMLFFEDKFDLPYKLLLLWNIFSEKKFKMLRYNNFLLFS